MGGVVHLILPSDEKYKEYEGESVCVCVSENHKLRNSDKDKEITGKTEEWGANYEFLPNTHSQTKSVMNSS